MNGRTSSPALYAARILRERYAFTVRQNADFPRDLKADERCIAIIIDHKTNVKALVNLRPKLNHWQRVLETGINDDHTARQITFFIRELIDALEAVPHYSEEEEPITVTTQCVTSAGSYAVRMKLSKAALESMATLYHYYEIKPIQAPLIYREEIERIKVAKLIDCCTSINHPLRTLPALRVGHAKLLQGQSTPAEVLEALRTVWWYFEQMPSYDREVHSTVVPSDFRDETKMLA